MVDLVAEKGKWKLSGGSSYSFYYSSSTPHDILGIEVKTRSYPLKEIEALMADYHKENHAGKLVLRVSNDI